MTDEAHRNPAWEDKFIADAAEGIEGAIFSDYLQGVHERLEKGKNEYGPASYLEQDVPQEVREEAFDGAGWAVLWAEKLRTSEKLGSSEVELVHAHIADAIRHFILAYASLQAAHDLVAQFEHQA